MSAPTDFHQLLDAAPDAMVVVDRLGLVTALNLEAVRCFGWSESELIGEPMSRVVPKGFSWGSESDLAGNDHSRARSTEGRTVSCFARRRNGSEFPVELASRPFGTSSEAHSLVTLRDLTSWRRAQETRSRSNEQARDALVSIGDAVITTDILGQITYLNPVAERLCGWVAEEAIGQLLDIVMPLISEASRQPIVSRVALCLEEGRSIDLEDGVLLLRRDGTEVPVGDSTAPVRDRSGEIVGVVMVIQDESEKRRVGHRLSHEATHDQLTGLINRREFERQLAHVVTSVSAAEAEHMLVCLDLDGFKVINDTCGHDAGDDLLRSLGPLLSRHLRKHDMLARLGGDEFGVLLENCPLVEAERIAESLRAEIEQYRFEWAGKSFTITASIGVATVRPDDTGIGFVLRVGDAACYAAKESGGNRVHVVRPGHVSVGMSEAHARRVALLTRAVDDGEFRLYAQPIIKLQPGLPARPRFEILLRLPDGEDRMRSAADFLPQAVRYNLMMSIDRWVVGKAIGLLGQWHRDHPGSELPVFSINLGASALSDDGLVPVIEQELASCGVPADALCFEIAESSALVNLARTIRLFSIIRRIGCGTALEDFGSGMASFASLRTLPVDFLKIGGRFVREAAEDPMYGSIVGAVNQIGRSMGISTIAKQVSSKRVLHKLRTLGVGYAQGHAVASPMPLTDPDGRVVLPSLQSSTRSLRRATHASSPLDGEHSSIL